MLIQEFCCILFQNESYFGTMRAKGISTRIRVYFKRTLLRRGTEYMLHRLWIFFALWSNWRDVDSISDKKTFKRVIDEVTLGRQKFVPGVKTEAKCTDKISRTGAIQVAFSFLQEFRCARFCQSSLCRYQLVRFEEMTVAVVHTRFAANSSADIPMPVSTTESFNERWGNTIEWWQTVNTDEQHRRLRRKGTKMSAAPRQAWKRPDCYEGWIQKKSRETCEEYNRWQYEREQWVTPPKDPGSCCENGERMEVRGENPVCWKRKPPCLRSHCSALRLLFRCSCLPLGWIIGWGVGEGVRTL